MSLPEENVQDYPRPPRLEPVQHEVTVTFAGRTVAGSRGAYRVLETHHAPTYYIPMRDWVEGVLKPAPAARGSVCEWKGRAVYFDVAAGRSVARAAAWGYPEPTRGFADIAECVAVYAGKMESCWVDGIRVVPQPGDFYGGWVTPNLTGRIKGGPGTAFW